jgi:hypothetical protein
MTLVIPGTGFAFFFGIETTLPNFLITGGAGGSITSLAILSSTALLALTFVVAGGLAALEVDAGFAGADFTVFLAVTFLAVTFLAVTFLAVTFLAVTFLAGAFFATDFFATDFFATDFFATDFFATDFLTLDLEATFFTTFFATGFFAGAFFEPATYVAPLGNAVDLA